MLATVHHQLLRLFPPDAFAPNASLQLTDVSILTPATGRIGVHSQRVYLNIAIKANIAASFSSKTPTMPVPLRRGGKQLQPLCSYDARLFDHDAVMRSSATQRRPTSTPTSASTRTRSDVRGDGGLLIGQNGSDVEPVHEVNAARANHIHSAAENAFRCPRPVLQSNRGAFSSGGGGGGAARASPVATPVASPQIVSRVHVVASSVAMSRQLPLCGNTGNLAASVAFQGGSMEMSHDDVAGEWGQPALASAATASVMLGGRGSWGQQRALPSPSANSVTISSSWGAQVGGGLQASLTPQTPANTMPAVSSTVRPSIGWGLQTLSAGKGLAGTGQRGDDDWGSRHGDRIQQQSAMNRHSSAAIVPRLSWGAPMPAVASITSTGLTQSSGQGLGSQSAAVVPGHSLGLSEEQRRRMEANKARALAIRQRKQQLI